MMSIPKMSNWQAFVLAVTPTFGIQAKFKPYSDFELSRTGLCVSVALAAVCLWTTAAAEKGAISWEQRRLLNGVGVAGGILAGACALRLFNGIREFQKFVNDKYERLSGKGGA